jgi:hypothetical protein
MAHTIGGHTGRSAPAPFGRLLLLADRETVMACPPALIEDVLVEHRR